MENERASISACGIANYKLAADHWQLLYSGFEGDGLGFVLGDGGFDAYMSNSVATNGA